MIWAALVLSSALAAGLPPRPVQDPLSPTDCPEAAVIDGQIDELVGQCSGLVLSIPVWAHLEALAADSRAVRRLYDVEAIRHQAELVSLQRRIDELEAPVPVWDRPGVRGGAAAVLAVAAVIGYEAATRALP